MRLTLSLFSSAQDRRAKPRTESWSWWCSAHFAKFDVRGGPECQSADKATLDRLKNGPAVVLGPIEPGLSHTKANVREAHAVGLDFDSVAEDVLFAQLDKLADFHYALWTTYKHGTDAAGGLPRVRVVLPLAAPVSAADYPTFWERLSAWLDGTIDPATKDISRLHFLPATWDVELAGAESAVHEGERFFAADDATPLPKEVEQSRAGGAGGFVALTKLRTWLKWQSKDTVGAAMKGVLSDLLAGRPLSADVGDRHATLLAVTSLVASRDATLSDESIAALFGPTIEAMLAEDPERWERGLDEVLRAYRGAADQHDDAVGPKAIAREGAYSAEELARIAEVVGCDVGDLEKRWLLHVGKDAYYFLTETGYYSPPVTGREAADSAVSQYLARAPVTLSWLTPTGSKTAGVKDVFQAHGTWLPDAVIDYSAEGSYYDAEEGVLVEAVPRRITEADAEEDPEVATWLEIVGGDKHEYLLDWLAQFPDLTQALQGLYLSGPPDTGKTLFARALSRLWRVENYVAMAEVTGSFNDQMARCPLIVADEGMDGPKGKDPSVLVRRMIGTTRLDLKRKFRNVSCIRGAVRFLFLANNTDLLYTLYDVGSDDVAALEQRVVTLAMNPAASDYLDSLGGRKHIDPRWVLGNRLVKHAMFLRQTRSASIEGKRWATVAPKSATLPTQFLSAKARKVLQWLVTYFDRPEPANSHVLVKPLILVGDGVILVNSGALVGGWKIYHADDKEVPTGHAIGRALSLLSVRDGHNGDPRIWKIPPGRTDQVAYYSVDPNHLAAYVDETGFGSTERILASLSKPLNGSGK